MSGLDLSQFYETFFDEADELLAQMEQLLLGLDAQAPDIEQLNAIFRAAHSIKGGAATFGTFQKLAETTHLLENLITSYTLKASVNECPMVKAVTNISTRLISRIEYTQASASINSWWSSASVLMIWRQPITK